MVNKLIYMFFVLSLFACEGGKTNFHDTEELNSFLNNVENGFIQSSKTGDLFFETKLIPPDINEKVKHCTIQLRISRLDGGAVLELGNSSKEAALEREAYLMFEVSNDVTLNINNKSINCDFHHYERNYGLKPSVDMFFVFPVEDPNDDVDFLYRDELFGQGMIKLNFNKTLFKACHVEEA